MLWVQKVYRGSRQDWASAWKGEPARVIRQRSLIRHSKYPELKIIRAQESTQGKYHSCLPLLTVLQQSNYGQWVSGELILLLFSIFKAICLCWVLHVVPGTNLTQLTPTTLLEKGRTAQEKDTEKPPDGREQEMRKREVD